MSKINQSNLLFIGIYYLTTSFIFGQITKDYKPYSITSNKSFEKTSILLPHVNSEQLMDEDEKVNTTKKMRFGYEHKLNHNFLELAHFSTHNDKQIFIMQYYSHEAYALRAIFESFNLPEGVNLFIYNPDISQIEGAYTSENNNESLYLSSPLIQGDRIILELNVDSGVNHNDIQLNIDKIIHDYRGIIQIMENNYSNRQCGSDVMCEQAEPYVDQINSSAFLDMGYWICSGSMVNNMNQDLIPYFLTANHCTDGNNPQGYRFYFNYFRHGCNDGPIYTGANAYSSIIRSSCDCITDNGQILGPDFTLLEITDNIPIDWDVYYAGFNATDPAQMLVSVGVHHPNGEPKKINYDSGYSVSDFLSDPSVPNTHWRLNWDNGGTEPGSSGSPIFDDAGRISGILTGGSSSNCDGTDHTWYGKIASSWEWGDTPETRLKDWLDPNNTQATTLSGTYIPVSDVIPGDATLDNLVNVSDITLVIQFIQGTIELVFPQNAAADLNSDGIINIQDIIMIVNNILNNY